jgi:AcrR family transcriptional regulator
MRSRSAPEPTPVDPPVAQPPAVVGLRERKKARTRAAIQSQAIRLFRDRGYDSTTVEQIAEAAEVSQSTFFRYFPTKEDVVMYDVFDPLFIQAFRAQPSELAPLPALRRAMRQVFANMPAAVIENEAEREKLIKSVPELRSRMLHEFMRSLELLIGLLSERTGRPTTDIAVRSMAGAIIGVSASAWLTDDLAAMDAGLAQLEAGLPL